MMNYRSAVAVVLSSVASCWLAGCAADAEPATSDDQVAAPAEDTKAANIESGFGKTAPSLPEVEAKGIRGLAEIRIEAKVIPEGNTQAPSDQKYENNGCDVGGEVLCSCGVCAPIWRCVAICDVVPQ